MAFDEDLRARLDQIVGLGTSATADAQTYSDTKQANDKAAAVAAEATKEASAAAQWQDAQKAAISTQTARTNANAAKTQLDLVKITSKQAQSNAALMAKYMQESQIPATKDSKTPVAGTSVSSGGKYIPPSTGAGNTFDNFVHAIVSVESGGNYKAIGPAVGNNQHAYGKYQIMQGNIPSWTKAALGHSITPQQFLNDPAAQDKTALYFLSGYYKKYGPGGAAMAWNGGPGSVGHSLSGYALTVLRRMGLQKK